MSDRLATNPRLEHDADDGGYWNRRSFSYSDVSPARRIVIGLAIALVVMFLAALGYIVNGWSWQDAIYMVVITVFGVGYGETQPIDTPLLRWLTITLIVCGYVAAIYAVGGFAQLLIDGELRRILGVKRMQKEIDRLENHVVICGFGRMGRTLAEALAKRGRALIVIDHEEARVEAARGYGCLALHGNATEEKILRAAGVQRASTLTTVLSDDVANVFITISARAMNPNLEILARAERTSTVQKLQQVGANEVILPANIGADRLANLILRPSAESLLSEAKLPEGLNLDLASLGLTLDEVEVKQDSCIIGETLAQLKACGEHRFLIVAVRNSEGDVTLHPSETQVLASGDCVILLAHIDDLNAMREKYQLQCQSELDAAV